MKKEFLVGSMILFLLFAPLTKAAFAAEEKKVCVKEFDNKTIITSRNLNITNHTINIVNG